MENIVTELLSFIDGSPCCFFAVDQLVTRLTKEGYTPLQEGAAWQLKRGGKYFVTRNLSSVIAFEIPKKGFAPFRIVASHSDSPTLKLKDTAEKSACGKYVQLNVEKYGGMILSTWMDRPLSIAGRVLCRDENGMHTRLVNVDKDLLVIPNVAIHMNREINDGYKFNVQTDMLPLYGDETAQGTMMDTVAESAGTKKENILGDDLFLYNRMKGTVLGHNGEYIAAPRLDDLECAFTSCKAFIGSKCNSAIRMCCVFDNEEVGSGTKQGALSTFLYDVMQRITASLGATQEDYYRAMASSFMLSADNAHSVHPNHPEKADPTNQPFMNGGIVVKFNANQKYTTDGVSCAVFRQVCQKAGVPLQYFHNRSDMMGGSTLGNLANTHTSMNTLDIGLAQLAMHSSYETAGAKDVDYMVKGITAFYNADITALSDGCYTVK